MSPKSRTKVADTEGVEAPFVDSVRGRVAAGVSPNSSTFHFSSRLDYDALLDLFDYGGTADWASRFLMVNLFSILLGSVDLDESPSLSIDPKTTLFPDSFC